jgi:DNA-binding NarL/FixJ family response regulator
MVFMDAHMPGMDGYAVIRTIRDWETETSNARTPIVILSSDDLELQTRSAAQSGCSGFLRKLLHIHDVAEVLERLRAGRCPVASSGRIRTYNPPTRGRPQRCERLSEIARTCDGIRSCADAGPGAI